VSKTELTDNPIRRIVSMLQAMQQKVEAEGKKADATHQKFMCYCNKENLGKEVADNKAKIEQLESSIKEGTAQLDQLKADIQQHTKDREAAEKNLAEVSAIREKEAVEYAAESDETKKNIALLEKAIQSIEKGMQGFLQTSTATVIQRLSIDIDMQADQREELAAWLSHKQGDGYAPASGDIVGILKTMKDDMEKDLAESTKTHKESLESHAALIISKQKEIQALSDALSQKSGRMGSLGVDVQSMKEDSSNTQASIVTDENFLKNKDTSCAKEVSDYDLVKKTRNDELLALSMTIKMLNDDDALEIFKKTLPSASLLQVITTSKGLQARALLLLNAMHHHDTRLDLIALALHSKKVNFQQVTKMIDDMVKLLDKEQYDDDLRQEICHEELDQTEDRLKTTEWKIGELEKAIKVDKSAMETISEDMASLANGIKSLDTTVVEATETRKEQHTIYEATLAENKASKELLLIAKNRLNKFYNPGLAKEEPKEELSDQERIASNLAGSEDGPTLVQVKTHSHMRKGGPQAVGAYKAKSNESAGVIEMIDLLVTDLDKEILAQEAEERDAQTDYENFIGDSKLKRTQDGKLISDKERTKADLEVELQKLRAKDKAKLREAYATTGVLGDLHQNCDWLLMNFDTRKEARAAEKDSLVKAKAVLAGME